MSSVLIYLPAAYIVEDKQRKGDGPYQDPVPVKMRNNKPLRIIICAVCVIALTISLGSFASLEKAAAKEKARPKIAIEAGHQKHANSGLERIGPNTSRRKIKVAGGTTGVVTRVPEYKLNLTIAKKLKKELESRGYKVYMVRTKNNVNISNRIRAIKANRSGADICIRLHADDAGASGPSGASCLYKTKANRYATAKVNRKSKRLSKCVLTKYCKRTGAKNRGLSKRNDLTGSNWSKIPTTLIEMGFMSNPSEDRRMQRASYQKKMVKGIADGIDAYYGYK